MDLAEKRRNAQKLYDKAIAQEGADGPYFRSLAELRILAKKPIVDGHSRMLRLEYRDWITARKVAMLARLLGVVYDIRIRWNKAERKRLFDGSDGSLEE